MMLHASVPRSTCAQAVIEYPIMNRVRRENLTRFRIYKPPVDSFFEYDIWYCFGTAFPPNRPYAQRKSISKTNLQAALN
jgi:hypothetical protein